MSATRNDRWVPVLHGDAIGRLDTVYAADDIADALERAEAIGLDLSPMSALEDLTMKELLMLVDEDIAVV